MGKNRTTNQSGLARLASTIFGNASSGNAAASTSKSTLDDPAEKKPQTEGAGDSVLSLVNDDTEDTQALAALAGLPMGFGSSKRSFMTSANIQLGDEDDSVVSGRTSTKKPPRKKRKTNRGKAAEPPTEEEYPEGWIAKYDASSLGIQHYTHVSQVPEDLKKYFSQRYRLLSLYSSPPGCLFDREGWYSITPEAIADQIAERCRCDTILDAFCGVGGNAIAFAKTCERVIALDTSPTRLALARHNAQIYGVAHRIEFILADYLSFARSYIHRRRSQSQSDSSRGTIDVVFLSPPWGGMGYLAGSPTKEPATDLAAAGATAAEYSLASIQPIHGKELFDLTREITHNVAYFLPRNTRMEEVGALVDTDQGTQSRTGKSQVEMIEVEEEWMGNKLKALTCYFGGLVQGQEESF